MKLRKLFVIILSALLFVCILNFYLNLFRFPFFKIDLFEAIPTQSALVIECNDLESLNKLSLNSPFWNSIQKVSVFERIRADLETVKDRLLPIEDSTYTLENNKFVAALQMSGAKSADFLYLIDSDGIRLNMEDLIDKTDYAKVNESLFLGQRVYEFVFRDKERFTVCFYKKTIILARFPFIVEDAIAQLNNSNESLSDQDDFQQAKKSIKGEPGVSIYFNFKRIPQLLDRTGSKESLNSLKRLGSMAILNFRAKDFEVFMDGNLVSHSKKTFKSGSIHPSSSEMFKVIPDNCSFLFWQSKIIDDHNNSDNKKYPEFQKYLKPWIGEEQAIFVTESHKSSIGNQEMVVFLLKDKDQAKASLKDYSKSKGKVQEYDYQTFMVNQLFSGEILEPFSYFNNDAFKSPFYTIIENYLIVANSKHSLEVLIDKHILNQTLSNNVSFLSFYGGLDDNSNTFLYSNTSLLMPLVRQFSAELGYKKADAFFDVLYNFKTIGLQLDRSQKEVDLNFYLNSSNDQTKPTKIIWTTKLAANAIIQPTITRNIKNDQNEIFVQDAQNRIYLFDRNGKLIWERSLKAPIISKIQQIQYYEDKENQIIFNTKNQIFLIDHQGKNVAAYPLKLPSPASNGLCVIDFENDKEYQIFIGTKNGSIYGFEKTGEPLVGWNPKEKVGKLVHDIQHFQIAGNDFILALNEKGDFHVFKRNGEKRFETASFDTKYLSPPGIQTSEKRARIVLANRSGKAKIYNHKGKHFNLYVGTGRDKKVKFLFEDLIGDERKDYISLSERNLSCYFYEKSKFKKAFNRQFEQTQDELFGVRLFESDKFQIGTLNRTNKRINLLQRDGSLFDGFPLSGTTKFTIVDLFDAQDNVLVVALDDSIYTCKID